MNYCTRYVMILCLVISVGLVMSRRNTYDDRPLRSCKSTNECYQGECCIKKGSLVYCKKLSEEEEKCSEKPLHGNTCHSLVCPCDSKFWCDSSGYQNECVKKRKE